MKRLFFSIVLVTLLLLLAAMTLMNRPPPPKKETPVVAPNEQRQSPRESVGQQRQSPHETISRKIDGNRVTIVYGRPYSKDPKSGEVRKIWGALVPYDRIWRLGADEATLLLTQQALDIGGVAVPPGAYSLFMLPTADGPSKLIINEEIGQWGIDPYHPEREVGRVELKKEATAVPVDQLTLTLEKIGDSGGMIRLRWEQTEFSTPYKVRK